MQPLLPTNPKSLVPGALLKADLESCLGQAESSHPEMRLSGLHAMCHPCPPTGQILTELLLEVSTVLGQKRISFFLFSCLGNERL